MGSGSLLKRPDSSMEPAFFFLPSSMAFNSLARIVLYCFMVINVGVFVTYIIIFPPTHPKNIYNFTNNLNPQNIWILTIPILTNFSCFNLNIKNSKILTNKTPSLTPDLFLCTSICEISLPPTSTPNNLSNTLLSITNNCLPPNEAKPPCTLQWGFF